MRLLVAITDLNWFNYLSELRPDEVNFWQPGGSAAFRALSSGEPLLFKFHAPNDFIVGVASSVITQHFPSVSHGLHLDRRMEPRLSPRCAEKSRSTGVLSPVPLRTTQ